ncbi:hypothetical protein [uncultured Gammaproteobacteria bacterium]|nr:hypothetical protein [uncultured Gammaproteobacteria bacterium]
MSYRLSSKAEDDIIAIFIEDAREFGIKQAQKYLSLLSDVLDLLDKNPKLAQQRFEINPPVRIYPFQAHLIIYLIDTSNNILIVRVRPQREDWVNN